MDGNDSRPDWRVIVMAALFWFVAVTWLLASYLMYCREVTQPFLEQGFCLYNALSYNFFCCFASIKPYWMQICPFLVSFLTFFPPWYVGVKRKFEHVLPCFMPQGDCSRMSISSGNRTSASVQALDHKSHSLPLGHCDWRHDYEMSCLLPSKSFGASRRGEVWSTKSRKYGCMETMLIIAVM